MSKELKAALRAAQEFTLDSSNVTTYAEAVNTHSTYCKTIDTRQNCLFTCRMFDLITADVSSKTRQEAFENGLVKLD